MKYLTETQQTVNEILVSYPLVYDQIIRELQQGADNHVITDCLTTLRKKLFRVVMDQIY